MTPYSGLLAGLIAQGQVTRVGRYGLSVRLSRTLIDKAITKAEAE